MNELEVLEALLAGEVVLAKRIDGLASNYNYKYRIINESNNRELQWYSFAYSTKYDSFNSFKVLFDNFKNYTYSIYKEKTLENPLLAWHKMTQSRMGKYSFRSEYWITPCKNYKIIPAIDRFLLYYNSIKLGETKNGLNVLKRLAQQHYEENC